MKPGEAVTVTGNRGPVACRVVAIEEPAGLPDVSHVGGPSVQAVRAIFAELGVTRVAFFDYDVGPDGGSGALRFAALETEAGWRDLHGQQLTIEARP